MHALLHDVRYAIRMLRKNPLFTLIAATILVLGIGANTAVFSVVNALLFHPYPFSGMEQLVLLRAQQTAQPDETRMTVADFLAVKQQSRSFQSLAAYQGTSANLAENGRVEAPEAVAVTANFFDTVGIAPAAGRTFTSEEEQEGADGSVIVSYGYWKKRFAGDPKLVGKLVRINGRPFTIVGIMPKDSHYPPGIQVWVPLALGAEERRDRVQPTLNVFGRLKPGISQSQAQAELQSMAVRWQREFPTTNVGRSITTLPMRKEQYEYTAPIFVMLQVGAIFVLLSACANLGNLLFARFFSRQHEIAIRIALGAARSHVVQALLAEVVILCTFAGVVAGAISFWTVDLIRNSIPPTITEWVAGWDGVRVDRTVLWFALALTLFVGVALGLVTALRSAETDPNEALKSSLSTGSSRATHRLRNALMITQFVFATILLVGAALMVRGFLHLADVYGGLQPNNVLTMQVSVPVKQYPQDSQVAQFYQRFLKGVETLPGIQSAATTTNIPASNVDNDTVRFTVEGKPSASGGEAWGSDQQSISPGFFAALKIPLLEGRAFSDHDDQSSSRVGIISKSMADRFWPNAGPIGKRLKLVHPGSDSPWITIIGVVGDIKQNWFDPRPHPILYLPYLQVPTRLVNIVVRTSFDPSQAADPIRSLLQQIDPDIAVSEVQAMTGVISDAISPVRLMGVLMALFGIVAVVLSCIGLYGVLSHGVSQRAREFGVRTALGATPRQLLALVLTQSLRICMIGLAVALPLSIALSQLMANFVFGVVTLNAATLVGLSFVLLAFGVASAYVPARRAAHVDPAVALRYE